MINFTDEQKDAIKPQGSLVITACPGSGKTAVISQKIKNELEVLKSYQGVVAITFTRKASKELETRCRTEGSDIKSSFFGTIDSFCLSEIIFPFINQVFGNCTKVVEPKYESDLTSSELEYAEPLKIIDKVNNSNILQIKELYKRGTLFFRLYPR